MRARRPIPRRTRSAQWALLSAIHRLPQRSQTCCFVGDQPPPSLFFFPGPSLARRGALRAHLTRLIAPPADSRTAGRRKNWDIDELLYAHRGPFMCLSRPSGWSAIKRRTTERPRDEGGRIDNLNADWPGTRLALWRRSLLHKEARCIILGNQLNTHTDECHARVGIFSVQCGSGGSFNLA